MPLQPPDDDNTSLQYQPPQYWPLFLETFRFDWQAVRELQRAEQPAATREGLRRKRRELEDIVQRPYRDAGFPDLGPISRWMVRTRYRLFGKWSLGPVAGRDEFGRDVLSRVFWGRAFRSSWASWPRWSRS